MGGAASSPASSAVIPTRLDDRNDENTRCQNTESSLRDLPKPDNKPYDDIKSDSKSVVSVDLEDTNNEKAKEEVQLSSYESTSQSALQNNRYEDEELARKIAQEMADAELAEKIANEMMDEEYALKLAADYEGTYSASPAVQPFVNKRVQEENDEIFANKMNDLYELVKVNSDMFHNEIQRIRDMSKKAQINSKANTEDMLLKEAREIFHKPERMKNVPKSPSDSKQKNDINVNLKPLPLSVTKLSLNDHQKQFFQDYGFVIIPNVIPRNIIVSAQRSAQEMLVADAQNDMTLDHESVKSFANLPERHRPDWVNCQNEKLRAVFSTERNLSLCRSLIGEFDFQGHKGVGKYVFAPRFCAWDLYPPQSKLSKKVLSHKLRRVCPSFSYDLNDLPVDFDSWSRQFLITAKELGMEFAPCEFENWHVDGWDVMRIASFDVIWGGFLSPLQRGNLGNIIVYPGSHHKISQFLRYEGARNSVWYDTRKGEEPLSTLPSLHSAGVCDGRPYEVLANEGDVVLMHPFLAHGVGTNVTNDPRLTVYCRLKSELHDENRQKMHNGEDLLAAHTWTGDIFSLQPGLQGP